MSLTSIASRPPRRRAPSSTPPCHRVAHRVRDQVAQDALEQHRIGVARHAARARRAAQRLALAPRRSKSIRSRSSSAASAKSRGSGLTAPASSLEMSSSALNRPSSASTDALMLCTTSRTRGRRPGRRARAANRPSACSGWRRSWLAAAKNWVLARFAISASLRAASAVDPRALELEVLLRQPVGERLVLEAVAQRLHQRAVVVASERQDRGRRHRGDEREDEMAGVALDQVAHHDRQQRGHDEPVERRQVRADQHDRCGDHPEQEHDQERLVRRASPARTAGSSPRPTGSRRSAILQPSTAPTCRRR